MPFFCKISLSELIDFFGTPSDADDQFQAFLVNSFRPLLIFPMKWLFARGLTRSSELLDFRWSFLAKLMCLCPIIQAFKQLREITAIYK